VDFEIKDIFVSTGNYTGPFAVKGR